MSHQLFDIPVCYRCSAFRILAASIMMAATSQSSLAQNLTLFEPIDTAQTPEQQVNRPSRDGPRSSDPEFVLTGTSRIGNTYSAILTHRSGESVVVRSSPNQVTRIEGFETFSITDVGQGRAVISYPGGIPCVDAADKGVRCNSSNNSSELQLVNSAPIARRALPQTQELSLQNGVVEVDDSVPAEAPINPFAALRNRAQGQDGAGQPTNDNPAQRGTFTARRIPPDEVPPGMRVVSTPFGDRLV
ncbi:MAG: hypothetical protein WD772_12930, partial [Pseudohongiellaceae bacterium]